MDTWHALGMEMETHEDEFFERFNCVTEEVTAAKLEASKATKAILIDWLVNFSEIYAKTKKLTASAGRKFEALNSQVMEGQAKVIALQEDIIKCKNDQLASVETIVKTEVATLQTAVKSEFSSWSSVVAQNKSQVPTITSAKLKEAVRSAVIDEDRSRNIIIFNKEENANEVLTQTLSGVFEDLNEKPRIIECRRIGKVQRGKPRPIKVKLTSSDAVAHILRKAKVLKSSEQNKTTFIAPDRTAEERNVNRILVEEIKTKMKTEPGLYHFIRGGQIVSVTKIASTQPT